TASETIQEGEPAVGITFTVPGGALNHEFTSTVKQRGDAGLGTGRIAISLDGYVESAPFIQSPSTQNCVISGRFTSQEIDNLRTVLKAGSLAVKPEITSQRVVGPTLGHDTVVSGLYAMIGALAAILVFIVGYYWWRLGFVAVASLVTTMILVGAVLSAFGATLTLPGLAGLVLTIGMAVDANVLIFERIREEMRVGKTPHASVTAGYERATLTILDANVTTLIAALVLFQFGTGPVKGFAVTLSLGVVSSLFTALFVTRIIFDHLLVNVRVKQLSLG
ncbi:MAG: protein translocase subunit SecD, partial [Thermodesulfobacteriota bacterium]